jgi:hypothetical protein
VASVVVDSVVAVDVTIEVALGALLALDVVVAVEQTHGTPSCVEAGEGLPGRTGRKPRAPRVGDDRAG